MALLVSDVLTPVQDTLLDPSPGVYWPNAELIRFLNQFIRTAIAWKPDLNTVRAFVNLVAGSEQDLPAAGMQFLDAYVAGNGQAVMVVDFERLKHGKYQQLSKMTAVADVKIAASDPRQPKKFWVFPRSTGSASTLEILYAALPTAVTATSDTYPLSDETQDAAYHYLLSMAYAKQTDRSDLNKSAAQMELCRAWFAARNTAQFGQAPKADQ